MSYLRRLIPQPMTWLVVIVLAVLGGGIAVVVTDPGPQPQITCNLTQPVYGTNPDWGSIGTWTAVLQQGQSVPLPDGDTAMCTSHGLEVK